MSSLRWNNSLKADMSLQMRNLGLRLSIYTFNALLRAVVEGRGISHAIRVVSCCLGIFFSVLYLLKEGFSLIFVNCYEDVLSWEILVH